MYSNKVDLKKIITGSPVKYCIVKIPEYFPNYYGHSDIDILVKEDDKMVKHLSDTAKEYNMIPNVFKINGKHHVDYLMINGGLNIKFDLACDLDFYKKIKTKPEFFDHIMDTSYEENGVIVPHIDCELAIRYMEYIEHINERPDKIKHLHFIEATGLTEWKILLEKYKL